MDYRQSGQKAGSVPSKPSYACLLVSEEGQGAESGRRSASGHLNPPLRKVHGVCEPLCISFTALTGIQAILGPATGRVVCVLCRVCIPATNLITAYTNGVCRRKLVASSLRKATPVSPAADATGSFVFGAYTCRDEHKAG
jgi:hypothetical protein